MPDEDRLTELEVRLAFQDELLDAVNLTVARQQQQIDLLQSQLRELYELVRYGAPGSGNAQSQHEIPPHY